MTTEQTRAGFMAYFYSGIVAMNIVSITFLIGLALWYVIFEPPYLKYINLPFPVKTPVVHPGQQVLLSVIRCNRDAQTHAYVTSHSLIRIDELMEPVRLPASATSIDPGCTTATSKLNQIPFTIPQTDRPIPAGRYIVRGVAEIQGTIRAHNIEWLSQPFDVVVP